MAGIIHVPHSCFCSSAVPNVHVFPGPSATTDTTGCYHKGLTALLRCCHS